MIAYLDASVILRFVLGQPDTLAEWTGIERSVASALVEVECLRTLDRCRLSGALGEQEAAERRAFVHGLLEAVEVVATSRAVLARASQPFPTSLGTLDAVHLATALLWTQSFGTSLTVATHDVALARAARASGLPVVGV